MNYYYDYYYHIVILNGGKKTKQVQSMSLSFEFFFFVFFKSLKSLKLECACVHRDPGAAALRSAGSAPEGSRRPPHPALSVTLAGRSRGRSY